MANLNDLEYKFSYHSPSPEGVERHRKLSEAFIFLAALCSDIVPAGREQALVLTQLETAKFWASAGVARNPNTR